MDQAPGAFLASELSRDGFLGGKLQILQPKSGYRAGIDPVLLAASVPAQAGDQVAHVAASVRKPGFGTGRVTTAPGADWAKSAVCSSVRPMATAPLSAA